MLLLRWFFLAAKTNREVNQEKGRRSRQIDRTAPTFIKIGQSMGTRADLLPLPFVVALGELQDNVPPFANEIALRGSRKRLDAR